MLLPECADFFNTFRDERGWPDGFGRPWAAQVGAMSGRLAVERGVVVVNDPGGLTKRGLRERQRGSKVKLQTFASVFFMWTQDSQGGRPAHSPRHRNDIFAPGANVRICMFVILYHDLY